MKKSQLMVASRRVLDWLMTGLVALMATFAESRGAGSDWERLVPGEYTVALYRFDEGKGNEAHCATGDPELTLRAKAAQWGERPGGGAVARFERRKDDATVFVGPTNNDKLQLRTCHEARTSKPGSVTLAKAARTAEGPMGTFAETTTRASVSTATAAGEICCYGEGDQPERMLLKLQPDSETAS